VCKKKVGLWSGKAQGKTLKSRYKLPDGMSDDDRLCGICVQRLDKEVEPLLPSETESNPKPHKPSEAKNFDSKNINTSKVVQYKDSNVCILIHVMGMKKEFYAEFSSLTAQGYELKSTFAPSTTFIGIGGAPMAICYFQKFERNKSVEESETTFVNEFA